MEYFNNFVMRLPNGVHRYIEKTGKDKSTMLQDINSVLYGYYCLYLSLSVATALHARYSS